MATVVVARPAPRRLSPSRLYVGIWWALAALAVYGQIAYAHHLARTFHEADLYGAFGLRSPEAAGGLVRQRQPLSGQGPAAAIRPGDLIIAVDGDPAPTRVADRARLADQLEDAKGPVVTLTTRSGDGAVRDHRLTRDPGQVTRALDGWGLSHAAFRLAQTLLIGAVHLSLALGAALLFFRARRDRVAQVISVSSLLLVASASYGPGMLYQPWPQDPLFPLLRVLIMPFGWSGVILGALIFPKGRFEPAWTRWVAAALAVYTAANLASAFRLVPSLWIVAANLILFGLAIYAQVVRYRRMDRASAERQQIRWAMLGYWAALAPIAVLTAVAVYHTRTEAFGMRVWLNAVVIPALLLIAVLCYFGGLLISLVRYRLYDADAVISRSAGYAILTLSLAGIWAGAEKVLEVLLESQFGKDAGTASAGLAAALAAFLVTPAHNRVMQATEQIFQRQLARLRRELPERVGDLRETETVPRIAECVLERLASGVRAGRSAVVLRHARGGRPSLAAVRGVDEAAVQAWLAAEGPALERNAHDLPDALFPLRLPLAVAGEASPQIIGWLLLGPRPDGSFYGKDELEALDDVTGPIARALHIAGQRARRDRALRAEIARLRKAVEAMAGRPAKAG